MKNAHDQAVFNRHSLAEADKCGCFFCQKVFSPDEIKEYHPERGFEGATALCPHCGIDSVIPDNGLFCPGGNEAFLKAMHEHWFGITHTTEDLENLRKEREAIMKEEGWL